MQVVSVCLDFLKRTNSHEEHLRILEGAMNCVTDKTKEKCARQLQGPLLKLRGDNKIIKRAVQILAHKAGESQKVRAAD